MPFRFTRRATLAGLSATLAAPRVVAQTVPVSLSAHLQSLDQLHSLVVRVSGESYLSEHLRGPGPDRIANIKSVSKTIHALLAGIAMDRGLVEGPDQLVLPLLGRAPAGDARDDLTIGHLLSMQAGLASTSGGNYGAWISSADWVDYALAQDLISTPGGRFIYSTGSWHILGAALSEASGMSLLQMAREWLGRPLGIEIAPWVRDPQGRYLGGNEMAMRPGDLARIGEMVLNGGAFDGQQVVSAEWIETSWMPRARSPWSGDQYGYGWFLTEFAGERAAYGRGYGGQMLVVVPGHALSIAITSDPTLPARSGGYFSQLRGLVDHVVREVVAG